MSANNDETRFARMEMVEILQQLGIHDQAILQVLKDIPRHRFVPPQFEARAYEDSPVPIGYDQTISQPYMVALMTQSLKLTGNEKVLEIGTGSGYQSAILATLASQVYTVERISELLQRAQEQLTAQKYRNIHFLVGDGSLGWQEEAPFDRIIAAAASPKLPSAWSEQLAEGGVLVAPLGSRMGQTLMRYTKREGQLYGENICGCLFVPLIGQSAWQES